MATRSEPTIKWSVPLPAMIGAVVLLIAAVLIGGADHLFSDLIPQLARDGEVGILQYVTIGFAALTVLFLLWGLIRRRLGPMRFAALLGVITGGLVLLRGSEPFWFLGALAGAALLGAILIFTAPRPKSVVYR